MLFFINMLNVYVVSVIDVLFEYSNVGFVSGIKDEQEIEGKIKVFWNMLGYCLCLIYIGLKEFFLFVCLYDSEGMLVWQVCLLVLYVK